MSEEENKIILYTTDDGKSQVSLMSRDGRVWLNQKQMVELFAVTKMNISLHIANILREKELDDSVVKSYFTTATDGKRYNVIYYALEMILAVGFRVRGVRGTQFRQWANAHLSEYLVKGFTIDDARITNPAISHRCPQGGRVLSIGRRYSVHTGAVCCPCNEKGSHLPKNASKMR